jgi:hypothetical protein
MTEVIEKTIPLFKAREIKRLRYSTSFSLATTAGAVNSYVFAANGLYDPDVTGTGHQPMGFDEMMLYYNHFCVLNCKIQVIAKCVSSSRLTICLRMDGSSTPLTVIDRIVEVGGAVIDYLDLGTTYGGITRLELAVDIAKLQGISRSALTADSTLRGTVAANPSELSYFHFQVWDAAAQTGTVNCDVVMDFVSVFMEPRDITESITERVKTLVAFHVGEHTLQLEKDTSSDDEKFEVVKPQIDESKAVSASLAIELMDPSLDDAYFVKKYGFAPQSMQGWRKIAYKQWSTAVSVN